MGWVVVVVVVVVWVVYVHGPHHGPAEKTTSHSALDGLSVASNVCASRASMGGSSTSWMCCRKSLTLVKSPWKKCGVLSLAL